MIKIQISKSKIQNDNLKFKIFHSEGIFDVVKIFRFALCIFILRFAFCILHLSEVSAQSSIRSPNYKIDWPNVNMGAGLPYSTNYKMGITMGQTAPGLYSSTGYKIRAGFQYIHSIIPFSFSISDISIDFGSLTPGVPTTQTNTLTVSVGGAGGYVVKASENNPLKSTAGATIPDTLCDGGANTCTETTAKPWTSNSAYGFGFNMSGTDIPADFVDSTYFRQFADRSVGEQPQTIMTGTNVGRNKQATVTYKVNISSLQPAGRYENILSFLAIPSY